MLIFKYLLRLCAKDMDYPCCCSSHLSTCEVTKKRWQGW